MGFSHTHLSGTGAGDMLDVLIIPNVGEVKWNPARGKMSGKAIVRRFLMPRRR